MDPRNPVELCLIVAAVLFGIIMGFASLIPAWSSGLVDLPLRERVWLRPLAPPPSSVGPNIRTDGSAFRAHHGQSVGTVRPLAGDLR
jgi:hypothetical protein